MPTITIPKKVAKEGIVIVPRREYENLLNVVKMIPREQLWFWTKEWQARERKADQDIRLGKVNGPYRTRKELVSALGKLK